MEENYYGFDYWRAGQTLAHHGIKGQKWGVRRYQNSDGSLTNLGKQRYTREGGKEYRREMYNRYRAEGNSEWRSKKMAKTSMTFAKQSNITQNRAAKKLQNIDETIRLAKKTGDPAYAVSLGKKWMKQASNMEYANLTYEHMTELANATTPKNRLSGLARALGLGAIGGAISGGAGVIPFATKYSKLSKQNAAAAYEKYKKTL